MYARDQCFCIICNNTIFISFVPSYPDIFLESIVTIQNLYNDTHTIRLKVLFFILVAEEKNDWIFLISKNTSFEVTSWHLVFV